MKNSKLIKARYHSFTQWTKYCSDIYSENLTDFSESFSDGITTELSSMVLTEKKKKQLTDFSTHGLNCITYSMGVDGIVVYWFMQYRDGPGDAKKQIITHFAFSLS